MHLFSSVPILLRPDVEVMRVHSEAVFLGGWTDDTSIIGIYALFVNFMGSDGISHGHP